MSKNIRKSKRSSSLVQGIPLSEVKYPSEKNNRYLVGFNRGKNNIELALSKKFEKVKVSVIWKTMVSKDKKTIYLESLAGENSYSEYISSIPITPIPTLQGTWFFVKKKDVLKLIRINKLNKYEKFHEEFYFGKDDEKQE